MLLLYSCTCVCGVYTLTKIGRVECIVCIVHGREDVEMEYGRVKRQCKSVMSRSFKTYLCLCSRPHSHFHSRESRVEIS